MKRFEGSRVVGCDRVAGPLHSKRSRREEGYFASIKGLGGRPGGNEQKPNMGQTEKIRARRETAEGRGGG